MEEAILREISDCGSSVSPKRRAPAGQAVTQAGRLPALMSSRQPSPMHLLGRPVFGLDQRASYGQEATQ